MFFAITWLLHGITEYNQFIEERYKHDQPVAMNLFWNEFIRQTMENWQSEFLQLSWQIDGLMIFFVCLWLLHKDISRKRKKILEKLLELQLSKDNYSQFMNNLIEKYPDK